MRGPRSNKVRLLHIVEAADIVSKEYQSLAAARPADGDLRYYGFLKLIEIIGEAASQLSPELRAAHPVVPWRDIINARNVVVHNYDDLDEEKIWAVIIHDLPLLRQQVLDILATLPE